MTHFLQRFQYPPIISARVSLPAGCTSTRLAACHASIEVSRRSSSAGPTRSARRQEMLLGRCRVAVTRLISCQLEGSVLLIVWPQQNNFRRKQKWMRGFSKNCCDSFPATSTGNPTKPVNVNPHRIATWMPRFCLDQPRRSLCSPKESLFGQNLNLR